MAVSAQINFSSNVIKPLTKVSKRFKYCFWVLLPTYPNLHT